jgi:phage shock protein E
MSSLSEIINEGALIVDVRSVEEFDEEHYPGALNIPVDEVHVRLHEFGAKERSVVLYCASGVRSAYAAKLLKGAGFTRVINAGGLGDMPDR